MKDSKQRHLRIGLDARVFADKQYSGIPRAVFEIVKNWIKYYPEHEYYLITSVPVELDLVLPDNWHIVSASKWIARLRLWNVYGFRHIVNELHLDVFWGTNFVLPGKIRHTKQVVTVYDFSWAKMPFVTQRRNLLRLKYYVKRSCRIADKVVAISRATALDAAEYCRIPKRKIAVSYCGGLPERTEHIVQPAAGEKADGMSGRPYFLFMSTIEPRKNVITIVRAFDALRERRDGIRLVLAGKKGWNCEDIYERIARSKYREDIIVTGFVSDQDRERLFQHAAAFLYPSLYEGFGIPVLEAYEYGLPVITADNSSLPEVAGDAAFYVKNALDGEEMAGLMDKVLQLSDEERNSITEREKSILKRFSWKKNADEMMKIFQSIM